MNDHHDQRWQAAGRCTGFCCRMITLSVPAEPIAVMAAQSRAARARLNNPPPDYGFGDELIDRRRLHYDAEFVVDHFIHVRDSYDDAITGWRRPRPDKLPQYRCKAWTGRDCGAYDRRPDFCREHGSPNKPCKVPGCNLRWVYRDPEARWEDDGAPPRQYVPFSGDPFTLEA